MTRGEGQNLEITQGIKKLQNRQLMTGAPMLPPSRAGQACRVACPPSIEEIGIVQKVNRAISVPVRGWPQMPAPRQPLIVLVMLLDTDG